MQVNSNGAMQQMQMQMRKMDGTGGGQGNGGMKDIMQSLSQEDRTALKEKMSSMDQTQRANLIAQMKQVDASTMDSQQYTQSLMDILNQETTQKQTTNTANSTFSVYA
ncbi:hypothetical protein FJR45_05390 [Sulfurimonas sediminis]|uniref:Uncharacterized protein n=1 Tax=Sulfurimonas sediminis TaxID=2590020 RepID=A0A7M1B0X1_9BACT|nr:hypothetical protein [Sulfurimonas sediminis]QOP43417.1 hypothetical protein FJR45_05390 [Sulfurimonas sediminis]